MSVSQKKYLDFIGPPKHNNNFVFEDLIEQANSFYICFSLYIYTHTHTYIYIYIYVSGIYTNLSRRMKKNYSFCFQRKWFNSMRDFSVYTLKSQRTDQK